MPSLSVAFIMATQLNSQSNAKHRATEAALVQWRRSASGLAAKTGLLGEKKKKTNHSIRCLGMAHWALFFYPSTKTGTKTEHKNLC